MRFDEFGNPIPTKDMLDPTILWDVTGRKYHMGDQRLLDPTTVDYGYLAALGFEQPEIAIFADILSKFFLVNNTSVSNYCIATGINLTPIQSQRLQYAYKLASGREVVNTQSYKSVASHAHKMYKGLGIKFDFDRIGNRGKHEIPRTAVIDGLKPPFDIWNSRNYSKMERTYEVEKIAKEYVTIKTDRIPRLKYADSTEVPGILKILSNENGIITVQIHKKYCRLCNRFVILVSRTNPDRTTVMDTEDKFNDNSYDFGVDDGFVGDNYTHGCAVIVAADGTILYLYAKTMGFDKYGNSKANISDTNSTRVLDYGFYAVEIDSKLRAMRDKLYAMVNGIYMKEFAGSRTYTEIAPVEALETSDDPEDDGFTESMGDGWD